MAAGPRKGLSALGTPQQSPTPKPGSRIADKTTNHTAATAGQGKGQNHLPACVCWEAVEVAEGITWITSPELDHIPPLSLRLTLPTAVIRARIPPCRAKERCPGVGDTVPSCGSAPGRAWHCDTQGWPLPSPALSMFNQPGGSEVRL